MSKMDYSPRYYFFFSCRLKEILGSGNKKWRRRKEKNENKILKQSGTRRTTAFVVVALQKVNPRTHDCQFLILTAERGVALDVWMLLSNIEAGIGNSALEMTVNIE